MCVPPLRRRVSSYFISLALACSGADFKNILMYTIRNKYIFLYIRSCLYWWLYSLITTSMEAEKKAKKIEYNFNCIIFYLGLFSIISYIFIKKEECPTSFPKHLMLFWPSNTPNIPSTQIKEKALVKEVPK